MAAEGNLWSFGYGSNMDVKALAAKKHVTIIEHIGAVLREYRMSFSLKGIPYAEPSYANLAKGGQNDEVHGVAFLMSAESIAELDRTESGYKKQMVNLEAYDGRILKGFVYINDTNVDEIPPTSRYLGVLVKGAEAAGLKKEYIERLKSTKTYVTPENILAIRKALPKPEDLPKVTVEEVAKHDGSNKEFPLWVGIFGYIIETNSWFGSHRGRDITTRMLMQFHGKGLDDNDDKGRPPYPITEQLGDDEKEYVWRWFDHYRNSRDGAKVVAYLQEFESQQKSGKSDWKLPEK